MSLQNKEFTIRTARDDEFETLAAIISNSFYNDPLFIWIVEDHSTRFKIVSDFFRLYMELGLKNGVAHVAETSEAGIVGVALWCSHDAMGSDADIEIEKFANAYAPRFQIFSDKLHAHVPPFTPYDYVMAITVLPIAHSMGIGSALIAHRLKELDRLGMSSYLEATTRLSAGGIYERLGYQPIGEPIRFPTGVELFPMWRNARQTNSAKYNFKIGENDKPESIMKFGNFDWRVLEVRDGCALLISDKVLEMQKYNETPDSIQWVNCSLRKFLNETFYDCFTDEEKIRIVETRLPSSNNPWFGTDGGKYTNDKIFVMSIEEIVAYFGDSGQIRQKNRNTKYFISDGYNVVRKAVTIEGSPSSWWLRTPGNLRYFTSIVMPDGRISVCGDFVNRSGITAVGVRPALWITL